MALEMTTDLQMLIWVSLLTLFLWLPYVLARLVRYGLIETISYRKDGEPVAAWATRAKKAHYNAIENLVPFAIAVLVAHITNAANDMTALASIVYFWARLAHYPLQISSLPIGRTVAFAIGWVAILIIVLQIIK